jgi:hypothetical protein
MALLKLQTTYMQLNLLGVKNIFINFED